ncbi:MAG: hypothetical protein H0W24_10315 [Lysobacter sp.]|nr:hypothetical protein [Lysobacter sp.]MDQ3269222.1 hypothetical protein [Pseudomonadota bacterium]
MTTTSRRNALPVSSRSSRSALRAGALAALAALMFAPLQAREYVPYPGSYSALLKSVEAADKVVLQIQVWTGFERDFKITLPDIVVPSGKAAAACEREMAERAKKFTESFLTQASRVETRDLLMHDSADDNAKAGVFTEAGSLADALRAEGLARPSNINADAAWCGA